jgi:L-xylulokinase
VGIYLLGIDNGGSAVKAGVYAPDGTEVAAVSVPYGETVKTDDGFTERDAGKVWEANCTVIRSALASAGIRGDEVIGIGVTGYGNGLHLVDGKGNAVYPHIVSTDSRANGLVETLIRSRVNERVNERTHMALWSAQPLILLKWFKEHRPDVPDKATYLLNIKDYIRARMTGECYLERTDASCDGFCNFKDGRPDKSVFRLLGVEEYFRLIPDIRLSTDICGRVTKEAAAATGLAAHTPVAAGMMDIEACAFANGVSDPSKLSVITGTWSMVEYLSEHPVHDIDLFINAMSYLDDYYLIAEGSPTSASNYDWLLDNVLDDWVKAAGGKKRFYRSTEEVLERIGPEDCSCIYLPYVYASNTNHLSKGAFLNLNGAHTKEHLLRGVLEGVAFAAAWHFEKLRKYRSAFSLIRMSGGITNSPKWTQIFCDVMKLPIETLRGKEQGAKGAAMCAGVACGAFASARDAIEHMTLVDRRYEPDGATAELYGRKYSLYKKAAEAIGAFSDEMYRHHTRNGETDDLT